MNFNLKLKKIRTFRKMTQKELSEKIGLTDQHRIVQYEKGVRVPKKDLVDKMAQALDVNPYTLYDTAGRDASEMMELLFWLDEFNPSALHLFLPRKFPGEKCNEVADTSVYYHDNDSWPAHAPVCMWFDYGVLNDFLKVFIEKERIKNTKRAPKQTPYIIATANKVLCGPNASSGESQYIGLVQLYFERPCPKKMSSCKVLIPLA